MRTLQRRLERDSHVEGSIGYRQVWHRPNLRIKHQIHVCRRKVSRRFLAPLEIDVINYCRIVYTHWGNSVLYSGMLQAQLIMAADSVGCARRRPWPFIHGSFHRPTALYLALLSLLHQSDLVRVLNTEGWAQYSAPLLFDLLYTWWRGRQTCHLNKRRHLCWRGMDRYQVEQIIFSPMESVVLPGMWV